MGINLQKGQKIDLTKGNSGINELMVGLGWDPVEEEESGGGFLGKIFGGSQAEFDCDASVLLLNADGKIDNEDKLIFFGNLESKCGSVKHMGDNRTGGGEGDDEQIRVSLNRVPADVHKIIFFVNIYDCEENNQDFGMIKNAFIRIVNFNNNQELAKFDLSEDYAGATALIAGEVYRYQGEWKFAAIGQSTNDKDIGSIVRRYC